MSSSAPSVNPTTTIPALRAYTIFLGLTVFFIVVQALTAGEFITDGLADDARQTWTDVHGFVAYPVMVFALVAAVIAFARLKAPRSLVVASAALFVGCVAQWLLGHAITTLGMDWVVPIHVVVAFVIYGLAIWLSVRSAMLRRNTTR
ncbi:hypothetical protein [Subtercola boreus]|nr:hypothetical protein [Subtercola boreus]